MTPLRNDTNLNTTVAPTTCEFVRGNGNDNAADIRAYQLTSSFDASRHFTALGNLVAIGALTNLASRRPGRFIGFLPRVCLDSGFSSWLGCDSSLGWTDSF